MNRYGILFLTSERPGCQSCSNATLPWGTPLKPAHRDSCAETSDGDPCRMTRSVHTGDAILAPRMTDEVIRCGVSDMSVNAETIAFQARFDFLGEIQASPHPCDRCDMQSAPKKTGMDEDSAESKKSSRSLLGLNFLLLLYRQHGLSWQLSGCSTMTSHDYRPVADGRLQRPAGVKRLYDPRAAHHDGQRHRDGACRPSQADCSNRCGSCFSRRNR